MELKREELQLLIKTENVDVVGMWDIALRSSAIAVAARTVVK